MAYAHKWRTVERAKAELGITATKGVGGHWYWALPSEPASDADQQQHRRHDEGDGAGGVDPSSDANAATSPHPHGGGGVDGADGGAQREDQDRQIADLQDSIARQREQVVTLASLQYPTEEAKRDLGEMEQRLEALQQSQTRR